MGALAKSKLEGLMARYQVSNCAGAAARDSVLRCKSANWQGAPMWRGPPAVPDIDETGVTGEFKGQTFKVAGCSVRKRVDPENVGGVDGFRSF